MFDQDEEQHVNKFSGMYIECQSDRSRRRRRRRRKFSLGQEAVGLMLSSFNLRCLETRTKLRVLKDLWGSWQLELKTCNVSVEEELEEENRVII